MTQTILDVTMETLKIKFKTWLAAFLNLLKHPNFWTMFRVAAIPLIVVLLLFPNHLATFLAALIFSLAAISDYLDGFLARRHNLVSNFGKMMDPLADKLLVASSFIMLVGIGWVPAWLVCIIIGREIAITGLRNLIDETGGDVSASWLGKYKTGFQIAALIPLILHYSYFNINFHVIGMFFLWIALALTIWSGADYFIRFRRLL